MCVPPQLACSWIFIPAASPGAENEEAEAYRALLKQQQNDTSAHTHLEDPGTVQCFRNITYLHSSSPSTSRAGKTETFSDLQDTQEVDQRTNISQGSPALWPVFFAREAQPCSLCSLPPRVAEPELLAVGVVAAATVDGRGHLAPGLTTGNVKSASTMKSQN